MSTVMPDSWFRVLAPQEEESFRLWARENAVPEHFKKAGLYHPSVRAEWEKMGIDWQSYSEDI